MAKETAEQKLLRLIEQNDAGASNTQEAASASSASSPASPQEILNAVQGVGGAVSIPPALLNILAQVKAFFGHTDHQGFNIRDINKALMAVVGITTIIFISSVISGISTTQRAITFHDPENMPFAADKLLPMLPDVQKYLSAISYRNIFHPFEKKEIADVEDEAIPVVAQKIFEKTKSLKLVGISWLDTPGSASAMVENIDSGVTYFLKSGEMVNGVNVQSIHADSIVLEFAGERMELKL